MRVLEPQPHKTANPIQHAKHAATPASAAMPATSKPATSMPAPSSLATHRATNTKRKRSQKVGLVLMIPTASLWLAGCSDSPIMAEVFPSVAHCVAKGHPQARCESEFARAERRHEFLAPHYRSQTDCASDFGASRCAAVHPPASAGLSASGELYRPHMAGILSSEFINTLQPSANHPTLTTQPLYQAINDASRYRTSANCIISSAVSLVQVTERSAQLTAAGIVRRGGFGANATTRHCSAAS